MKFRDYGIKQHERVLSDLKSAKASGMFGGAGFMLDELVTHAEKELDKMRQLPVPTGPPATLRLKQR